MKLHCNACGSEKRFSVIADVNETREIDSNGDHMETITSETCSMDFYVCLECQSTEVDDIDDGRES